MCVIYILISITITKTLQLHHYYYYYYHHYRNEQSYVNGMLAAGMESDDYYVLGSVHVYDNLDAYTITTAQILVNPVTNKAQVMGVVEEYLEGAFETGNSDQASQVLSAASDTITTGMYVVLLLCSVV